MLANIPRQKKQWRAGQILPLALECDAPGLERSSSVEGVRPSPEQDHHTRGGQWKFAGVNPCCVEERGGNGLWTDCVGGL
jgi:hypothetical protein